MVGMDERFEGKGAVSEIWHMVVVGGFGAGEEVAQGLRRGGAVRLVDSFDGAA
jgi:hypothetical protein